MSTHEIMGLMLCAFCLGLIVVAAAMLARVR